MKKATICTMITTLFAGGGVASVAPGTAWALSCAGDFGRRPDTGAVDVPTNALLWGYAAPRDRLLGPSGEAVEVDALELAVGDVGFAILVPRAELLPNADYTIVRGDSIERIPFRTSSGPATSPPPLPVFLGSETGTGSTWLGSPARYQTLDFDGLAEGDLGLLGDISTARDGDAGALDTLASIRELLRPRAEPTGPVVEWLSDHEPFTIGETDCSTWPAGAADRQDARFGTFDVAGNFSGWIDVPLELPSREEAQAEADRARAERDLEQAEAARQNIQEPRSAASCSTAAPVGPGNAGSLAWLSSSLGLLAAVARRRRR